MKGEQVPMSMLSDDVKMETFDEDEDDDEDEDMEEVL
jgi:hypothetical protein